MNIVNFPTPCSGPISQTDNGLQLPKKVVDAKRKVTSFSSAVGCL